MPSAQVLRPIGDLPEDKILRIIKSRRLTQVEAGAIFSIRQPYVSALMSYSRTTFQSNAYWTFLVALDRDIVIAVRRFARTQ